MGWKALFIGIQKDSLPFYNIDLSQGGITLPASFSDTLPCTNQIKLDAT
jgi:hypothetical protein